MLSTGLKSTQDACRGGLLDADAHGRYIVGASDKRREYSGFLVRNLTAAAKRDTISRNVRTDKKFFCGIAAGVPARELADAAGGDAPYGNRHCDGGRHFAFPRSF